MAAREVVARDAAGPTHDHVRSRRRPKEIDAHPPPPAVRGISAGHTCREGQTHTSSTTGSFRSLDGERPSGDPVKTTREKAEEKRAAQLELVREQVQNGSLVIRHMTDEERRRYPPRPAPPKRSAGGRGVQHT
jgi:hypothetical protein